MTETRGPDPALLLRTLEQLLGIEATSLEAALDEATNCIGTALSADKVDAFLYLPDIDTLVARGTSDTPMGRKQKALGLDRLPLANGGCAVRVYRTGEPYLSGRVDEDPEEVRGIVEGLGVRSAISVPLDVAGSRRGVLSVTSAQPNFFSETDLQFLQAVARWVGMVTHRAELVEGIAAEAAERGRQVAAQELITIVAHDLRNYVTPIKMRVDLLRRRAAAQGRDDDARGLAEAADGLSRLGTLISDLLDIERVEEGIYSADLAAVDLSALAQEIAASLMVHATEIQVIAPEPVLAPADAGRLRQAIENLLSNAIKHTPTAAHVTLSVSSEIVEDQCWAVMAVRDEGPGVAPELLPRLFQRFARGPESRGLGLGLYVAHRIAAAHGGRLTVDSKLGHGATFRLAIPMISETLTAGSNAAP